MIFLYFKWSIINENYKHVHKIFWNLYPNFTGNSRYIILFWTRTDQSLKFGEVLKFNFNLFEYESNLRMGKILLVISLLWNPL